MQKIGKCGGDASEHPTPEKIKGGGKRERERDRKNILVILNLGSGIAWLRTDVHYDEIGILEVYYDETRIHY